MTGPVALPPDTQARLGMLSRMLEKSATKDKTLEVVLPKEDPPVQKRTDLVHPPQQQVPATI